MKLLVVVRRFLGLHVNGPKPGVKREKARSIPMWSMTHIAIDTKGTLADVPDLVPQSGMLIRESVLNRHYKNWDTAKASIRGMVKDGNVSVRRVIGRGANDVLILRTK